MLRSRWAPAAVFSASVLVFAIADLTNLTADPIAEPVSRLVHNQHGWLIPVAIALAALATASGAGRISAALRHDASRHEVLAGRFLWVAAFALAVAAVVPADVVGYQVASWREIVHGGAGWIALLGFPVAACALRRRLSPWLTALAAACGVLCVAIVVIWLGLTRSWRSFPLGSHHTTFGLVERAAMTTAFAWLSLAAATLRTRPT